MKYNRNLKDWDMDCIKQVKKTYGKVSRAFKLRKQKLSGNIPGPSALPMQVLSIQPASTRISNLAPLISKFRKDCKHLTVLALPTQALLIQLAPSQISNLAPSTSDI